MVEFISGVNGTGKSKALFETAVFTAENTKGNVVYVDCSDKLKLLLPTQIRLINIADYNIRTAFELCGFLTGLCANNYDLTDVFIDSAFDFLPDSKTVVEDFLEIISEKSELTGVNFHFSICDKSEAELYYSEIA